MHFSPLLSLALGIVALVIPTLWELWDDRKGETKQEKKLDLVGRFNFAVSASLVAELLTPSLEFSQVITGILLSLAIHFLIFDYAIVMVLKKNGIIRPDANPFTYLGNTAKYPEWWVKMGPWWRFAVRIAIFAASLIIYF